MSGNVSPFEVSASDLYLAAAMLGLTVAVSAWFAVGLLILGSVLAALEFANR